jgi:hypothetical protein
MSFTFVFLAAVDIFMVIYLYKDMSSLLMVGGLCLGVVSLASYGIASLSNPGMVSAKEPLTRELNSEERLRLFCLTSILHKQVDSARPAVSFASMVYGIAETVMFVSQGMTITAYGLGSVLERVMPTLFEHL